jgi:phosphonate transport system substrate-binding protein
MCLAGSVSAAEKPPLSLGITQVYGPEHANTVAGLVEPYLTKALGSKVSVQVFADADELAQALAEKKVDLAWITPLAFVHASQKDPEVLALSKAMRGGSVNYRAVFFVKADAAATKLSELKGKRVAWVSKASTSGYLFPRELVRQSGADPAKFFSSETFAGDHPAACAAVKSGAADVGATFGNDAADEKDVKAFGCGADASAFRVVAATANVPNEVIAARSDFPPMRINDVVATFGRMTLSDAGKKVLQEAFRADGWGVPVEGDFAPVLDLVNLKNVKAKVAPTKPAAKHK